MSTRFFLFPKSGPLTYSVNKRLTLQVSSIRLNQEEITLYKCRTSNLLDTPANLKTIREVEIRFYYISKQSPQPQGPVVLWNLFSETSLRGNLIWEDYNFENERLIKATFRWLHPERMFLCDKLLEKIRHSRKKPSQKKKEEKTVETITVNNLFFLDWIAVKWKTATLWIHFDSKIRNTLGSKDFEHVVEIVKKSRHFLKSGEFNGIRLLKRDKIRGSRAQIVSISQVALDRRITGIMYTVSDLANKMMLPKNATSTDLVLLFNRMIGKHSRRNGRNVRNTLKQEWKKNITVKKHCFQ